jgi:hypothetical protein
MASDDLITQVAELAELIVDEVSKADQDWQQIAVWARELAELTASAVPPDE